MRDHTIGFVGTGAMGLPMAGNLLDDGFQLQVYNRTRKKAEPLADSGAEVVETPREAAEGAELVLTMVSDDKAVAQVTTGPEGIVEGLGAQATHVVMSTISPATARHLADAHQDQGLGYVAAPVFGRPEAAEARELWILCSGPDDDRQAATPVIELLGQRVFDLGEEVGAANVVKLAGNFQIAAAIESMAEAFTFAEKQGVDRAKLARIMNDTLFGGLIHTGYGQKLAHHDYPAGGFSLKLGLKDVDLVLESAKDAEVPMPLASLLHDRYLSQVAKGREDLDWAAIGLGVSEDAGLEPET